MLHIAGSSPDVIEFFFFFNIANPSSCTVVLGCSQPLTEMSTMKIPGGKGQLALTTLVSAPEDLILIITAKRTSLNACLLVL
jgi:hypothetical protein